MSHMSKAPLNTVPDRSSRVEELVACMTIREKIGQLVIALNNPEDPGLSDVERLIGEYRVGSLISYGYHGFAPQQAAERNDRLQRLAVEEGNGVPLLNAGDFEQGLASQIGTGVTDLPHQMGVAAGWSTEAAEQAATITGIEARALGFTWSFTPVADVNVESRNPVIGVRSFGDDTSLVDEMVKAQVRGYKRSGVLSSPKHFPGHGAASSDSHLGLPTIDLDRSAFEETHLRPFVSAISAGAPTVMTAHVVLPTLDPDVPATLSRRILTGLLRDQMGFRGIVVTDLMSMGAISQRWQPGIAGVLAVQAGADVVMAGDTTASQIETIEAILCAAQDGTIPVERVDQAVRRVLTAKESVGLFERPYADVENLQDLVGSDDHRAAARVLADASITLLKNDGPLPFDDAAGGSLLLAGVTQCTSAGAPRRSHIPRYAGMVSRISRAPVVQWTSESEDPTEAEVAGAVAKAQRTDRILVLTYGRGSLPEGQARLVRSLQRCGKPMAVIATGTPYDIKSFPDVPAYIACYALGFVSSIFISAGVMESVFRVVFGQSPGGRLPVTIDNLYEAGHGLSY